MSEKSEDRYASMTEEELRDTYIELGKRDEELEAAVGDDFDHDIVQYIKFTVRMTKDDDPRTMPTVAGIQLLQLDGTHAEFSDAWCNTWSSKTKPEHFIDNSADTIWKDEKNRPVILELKEPTTILGYRLLTPNDEPESTDPKHWQLEASKEKDSEWHLIHEEDFDGELPSERGRWSVLIPLKNPEECILTKHLWTADAHELEKEYHERTREEALFQQEHGPTQDSVADAQVTRRRKEEVMRNNMIVEEEKLEELDEARRRLNAERTKANRFYGDLKRAVTQLVEMVAAKYEEGNIQDLEQVLGGIDTLQEIENERETELQRVATETDASKSADQLLTQGITTLQARCAREIPQVREDAEANKRSIYNAFRKEVIELENRLNDLDIKNGELTFHAKRGTNFKDNWKAKVRPGGFGNDPVKPPQGTDQWDDAGLKAADSTKRAADADTEEKSETQRLKRQYQNLLAQYKREKAECSDEMAELKRVFNNAHKDRTSLGQERCELETICADFSSVIERLQAQTGVGATNGAGSRTGTPAAHSRRQHSPLPTKFTLGNGRVSPRPSVSPRRSVSETFNRGPARSATPRRTVSESYARSRVSPRPHTRSPMVVAATPR